MVASARSTRFGDMDLAGALHQVPTDGYNTARQSYSPTNTLNDVRSRPVRLPSTDGIDTPSSHAHTRREPAQAKSHRSVATATIESPANADRSSDRLAVQTRPAPLQSRFSSTDWLWAQQHEANSVDQVTQGRAFGTAASTRNAYRPPQSPNLSSAMQVTQSPNSTFNTVPPTAAPRSTNPIFRSASARIASRPPQQDRKAEAVAESKDKKAEQTLASERECEQATRQGGVVARRKTDESLGSVLCK